MSSKPNLLLITTDQQRADCLGIERSDHPVMTPHLDQLAHEGVRFSRAYSDCPLCIPARTTIMTGQCAYTHGVHTNGEFRIPVPGDKTLPGRLTAAGYQTHAAGKMHFYPPRNRNGFERMRLLPEDYVNDLEQTPYAGMYRGHGIGGNEVFPTFSAMPAEYTPTHWTVEESIDFLRQRDQDAPFFMWTSFEAPHPPFDPPEEYVRLYDGRVMPKPVQGEWNGEGEPAWVRTRKLTHKLDQLDSETIAAARKHYYAMITHIDYALGRLFGELKTEGIWDDTVIVFASDHGEMLGDHGLFHKSCFYEPSSRVPLIIKPARSTRLPLPAGSVCRQPVMLADLYPTFMELAGCSGGAVQGAEQEGAQDVEGAAREAEQDAVQDAVKDAEQGEVLAATHDTELDGRSLLEMMTAETTPRHIYGYIEHQGGMYMVTDGVWKYLYFEQDRSEQLFHLAEDPAEQHDLSMSDQAECASRLAAFRSLLTDKFAEHQVKPGTRTEEAIAHEQQLRSQNSFAWRGPIRYGGHW